MPENATEEILARDWRRLVEMAPDPVEPPHGMALRPAALFAQLEEVREDWRVLVEDIRPDELSHFINASWTLRELLAHLASWAKEFRQAVETASRGGGFDYSIPYALSVRGPNEWNEEQVEARRERSLDEIRHEFDHETRRLQEIALDTPLPALFDLREFPFAPSGDPAATWKGPSAVVVAGKCEHDRHHFAQIRRTLASWRRA